LLLIFGYREFKNSLVIMYSIALFIGTPATAERRGKIAEKKNHQNTLFI